MCVFLMSEKWKILYTKGLLELSVNKEKGVN